ncbi:MAG: DUF4956 domain-containing protein [Solobacterium sp.]|nr:DUF4956 domain-containing protein [Solobacterium sp.]
MFSSILTGTTSYLSISQVLACTAASIVCGMIIALAYRYTERPSRNFLISVVILPAVVQMIILMVNGNLGVGVAVAGSFSLVRFRSLPGKASDIVIIFLAMGAGLMTGMGYIWLAVCCALLISVLFIITAQIPVFDEDQSVRSLRITIPEDLDYTTVFDDLMVKYTTSSRLVSSKTVNLGTMYQLTYEIRLKDEKAEKKMIDELRTRNGNLSIACGHCSAAAQEL